MDCHTARMLLQCSRLHAAELDADEAEALQRHLAACPSCDARARTERHADETVGRAMRQVEVPAHLRAQLLQRLEQERARRLRRLATRILPWAAAAAATVLLALGVWSWMGSNPPLIDPDYAYNQANLPQSAEDVVAQFRRLHMPLAAPNFNFAFLISHGTAAVPGYPGRVVPQLVFHQGEHQAVVFIIDTRKFKAEAYESDSASDKPHKLSILGQDGEPYQPGDRFAYLVFHNGDDLRWLKLSSVGA